MDIYCCTDKRLMGETIIYQETGIHLPASSLLYYFHAAHIAAVFDNVCESRVRRRMISTYPTLLYNSSSIKTSDKFYEALLIVRYLCLFVLFILRSVTWPSVFLIHLPCTVKKIYFLSCYLIIFYCFIAKATYGRDEGSSFFSVLSQVFNNDGNHICSIQCQKWIRNLLLLLRDIFQTCEIHLLLKKLQDKIVKPEEVCPETKVLV